MKLPAVFVLLMLLLSPAARAEREFMDMAGRIVLLPDKITCAFALDSAANAFLLNAAPDTAYMPLQEDSFGNIGSKATLKTEFLLPDGVQVLFSASPLLREDVHRAEMLSKKSGLPVVCLSSMPMDVPDVYLLLEAIFETDLGTLIENALRFPEKSAE